MSYPLTYADEDDEDDEDDDDYDEEEDEEEDSEEDSEEDDAYWKFHIDADDTDSEPEIGPEYDISLDAVDPEEVKREREKRYEANKKFQPFSAENECEDDDDLPEEVSSKKGSKHVEAPQVQNKEKSKQKNKKKRKRQN